MTEQEFGEQLVEVVGPALAQGPATRSDLLAAAVSARAPSTVIQALLELPERRFTDIDDVAPHLPPQSGLEPAKGPELPMQPGPGATTW